VVVSALAHVLGDIRPEHLEDTNASGWKLYTDSKLANIVFAQELARRLPKGEFLLRIARASLIHTTRSTPEN
jgi:hypothetical protein